MPKDLSESDLEILRKGERLTRLLPEVDEEIDDMIAFCIGQICHKAGRGALTQEEALAYCMELYSYQRLRQRFRKKADLAGNMIQRRLDDAS